MLDTDPIRTDFENITENARIILHPADANPIHRQPVMATHMRGYFYCDGTDPENWPDYYLGDVAAFCRGYELIEVTA